MGLIRRGVQVGEMCDVCGKEIETMGHILWVFEWTKEVWFNSPYASFVDGIDGVSTMTMKH